MKRCSQCQEREGVINLTEIKSGEVRTVWLCAKCAAEKGIQTASAASETPLGSFLAGLGDPTAIAEPATPVEAICPGCGSTFRAFKDTGRVGCAICYTSFEVLFRDLLRRLHGSTQHTGTAYLSPRETGQLPRDPPSLQALRDQLRRAIDAEQFELAAELRDRLKEQE
ncbi:MAG: UvrB/UvrC motif-containing protein [Gemmatimonadota bacterium]